MSERFVILSDLHLGKDPAKMHADLLRPVCAPGDHLVVNGDAAELQDPRYAERSAEQVARLESICREDGVTLTLLAGNHDPRISPRRHLFLAGAEILVTHGDAIHSAIAPWCRSAPIIQKAFDEAIESLPAETRGELTARLWASQHAAIVKWEAMRHKLGWISAKAMLLRPWSFYQVWRYWRAFPGEANAFVDAFSPNSRILITGHTHHQGVWHVRSGDRERIVINTGSYSFPGKPWAVVVTDRVVAVHPLVRSASGYHLGGKTIAAIELNTPRSRLPTQPPPVRRA